MAESSFDRPLSRNEAILQNVLGANNELGNPQSREERLLMQLIGKLITEEEKRAWNAKYTKPTGGIPKSDLSQNVQDSLGKADTALQTAPVVSVNDQTGTVVLDYEDVGADPEGSAASVQENVDELSDEVGLIRMLIPNGASEENQLADKNFVNSSIGTNTAYFIGTFASVSDLESYTGSVTNNDYAFVVNYDHEQVASYDRYKYNGSTSTWIYEYTLNNSSFTAAQWEAINSAITSELVGSISEHINNTAIHVTSSNKETWNAKYTKPTGGIPKSDLSQNVQDSLGKADTALENLTEHTSNTEVHIRPGERVVWNAKYNKPTSGIPKSDLSEEVQESLDKADTALQTETDPTVPAWAKAPTKPTYTKAEVELDKVANERQYSANNPPPYPVTSVNGQTGAVTVNVPEKISDLTNDLTASGIPNLPASKITSGTFADERIASAATWNAKYAKPSGGIPKIDLASGVQASLDKADSALQSAPVSSVNGKTGAVSLSYSDVGADASGAAATVQGNLDSHTQDSTIHVTAANKTTWNAKYAKPSGGIPKSDLAEAVQTSLDKADTALQSAPVSSVNNKTGAVELTYSDVGADESGAAATVQGNLTSHANDTDIHTTANEKTAWNAKYSKPSGGIPKSDLSAGVQSSLNLADTALQAAPVSSVNGKTGAVKINRYGTVTLTTSWTQSGNWYTQTASLTGITADDLVSIQLDDSTIEALMADGVTCLKCDNVNGTATFKCYKATPSTAITVQYELTEEVAAS